MEIEKCPHGSISAVDTLKALPENQAGHGRHKCATCALNAGHEAGFNAGLVEGHKEGFRQGLMEAIDLVESHGLASIRELAQKLNTTPPKKTPVHNGVVQQG